MGLLDRNQQAVTTGRTSSALPTRSNTPKSQPAAPQPRQESPGEPLHVRLRPASLEEVRGHNAVVKALGNLLSSKSPPHAFLFTGPAGTGKTTLGRIVASMVGGEVIDVNAARFSGVDSMREVVSGSHFQSLDAGGRKIYIIDEAHRLSKGAWDSLLLDTEEPPPHVWWVLCSTEPDKIPRTIQTRCQAFNLKPFKWEELADLMVDVIQQEKLEVPDVIDVLARRAMGSPRQALVYLQKIVGITDREEALSLIDAVDFEEGGPAQLARMICTGRGFSWDKAIEAVRSMEDENPESIRLIVVNYAASMIMNSKGDKESQRLLAVLDAFTVPYNQSERHAPLLLSIGRLLF